MAEVARSRQNFQMTQQTERHAFALAANHAIGAQS